MLLDVEGSVPLIPRPIHDSEPLPTSTSFPHPTYRKHNLILCSYLLFSWGSRCPWGFHIKIQYEYLTSFLQLITTLAVPYDLFKHFTLVH